MNKLVISECLKLYRQSREISMRECAKEIGVSCVDFPKLHNAILQALPDLLTVVKDSFTGEGKDG